MSKPIDVVAAAPMEPGTMYAAVKRLLAGASQRERHEALRAAMEVNNFDFSGHLRALSKKAELSERGEPWNRRDHFDLYAPMTLLSCVEGCLGGKDANGYGDQKPESEIHAKAA